MGDCQNRDLRVQFDGRLKLKFLGSKVTTDAGLLAYRVDLFCCSCTFSGSSDWGDGTGSTGVAKIGSAGGSRDVLHCTR